MPWQVARLRYSTQTVQVCIIPGATLRLKSVSVSKYRSIDKQSKFEVGDYTVLVGPNNQGKSNLMRAAVLALEVIENWSRLPEGYAAGTEVPTSVLVRNGLRSGVRRGLSERSRYRAREAIGYSWETDFPVFAQTRSGVSKKTSIRLDFELSKAEQVQFQEETGLSINEKLPLVVELGERKSSIGIPKQRGSGHKEKASSIARFITDRLALLYIPAVRPASVAINVADEILGARRRILARSPQYAEYIAKIEELEAEAASEVSEIIGQTLQRFMPQVQSVALETRSLTRSAGLEDIQINDGAGTSLTAKGDGIQSLVALALTLEWTKSNSNLDRQLIVAIEEPESHLHPAGVHELRRILQGMAESQQVLITTHSQSLINANRLGRNVIVSDGGARAARTIVDLRKSLGVLVSDSLIGAEVMVIGEGLHDARLLQALLVSRSSEVSELVASRRVVFESAGSATKISTIVVAANTIMSKPVVVLDGDGAGKREAHKLLESGLVDRSCLVQLTRVHAGESELEDLLEYSTYAPLIEDRIGFSLSARESRQLARGTGEAWSERLAAILGKRSVPDPESFVIELKGAVNAHVVEQAEAGVEVIMPEYYPVLDRIAQIVISSASQS